jgi:type II secretory ATPase GspE/PulE/Tfp pilus assembly ATPase PilB-like protein
MQEFLLPSYDMLMDQELSEDEQQAMMPISENPLNRHVEDVIARCFIYAVKTCSSDIHIAAHGQRDAPEIHIGIRTPNGLVNFVDGAASKNKRHYETKMLKLTNTAQGGSTPEILSTRFTMRFPRSWAERHGLRLKPGKTTYNVDVRVEYAKTSDGFKFVSRLLDQQRAPALEQLGLPYALERAIKLKLQEPSGLILATGPTGSGKTTLLNAMIGFLNNGQASILSIEDPVEFQIEGSGPITQIQVHGDVTYPKALRSALRQDPDIILIGEIRDPETMEIALQAGQTGHLVLSTLHTNSAADTFSRVLDLTQDRERDAMRVADTLKLVLAQRLVTRYAVEIEQRNLTRIEKSWISDNGLIIPEDFRETVSNHKNGKIALVEAIEVDYGIRNLILSERMDTNDIYKAASRQLQYETLATAGMRAIESGIAKIGDCQTRLGTNIYAGRHAPLRTEIARANSMNFSETSAAIDEFTIQQESDHDLSLTEFIKHFRGNLS